MSGIRPVPDLGLWAWGASSGIIGAWEACAHGVLPMAGLQSDHARTKRRVSSRLVAVLSRERRPTNPLADLDTQIMLQVHEGNRDERGPQWSEAAGRAAAVSARSGCLPRCTPTEAASNIFS